MPIRSNVWCGLALGTLLAGAMAASPVQADEADTTGRTVSKTFSFTGSPVEWEVPQGNTSVTVEALGGGGGYNGNNGTDGSNGALLTGVLNVTSGQTLTISVGGAGGTNPHNRLGGWGGMGGSGGATPDNSDSVQGGGGGGATTIETSPGVAAFVAGGGGGDGGVGANDAGHGGSAGTNVVETAEGLTALGDRGGNGVGPGSGGGGDAGAASTAAGTDGSHESWGGGDGGGGGGGVRGGLGGAAGHFGSGGGGAGGAGSSLIAAGVQSPSITVGSNLASNGSVTISWTTYLTCTENSMQSDVSANSTTTIQLPCSSTYPLTSITTVRAPEHATVFNVNLTTGAVDVAATYGYTGPDSFDVQIQDASGGTELITVNLDISSASISDPPSTPGDSETDQPPSDSQAPDSAETGHRTSALAATGFEPPASIWVILAFVLAFGAAAIVTGNRRRRSHTQLN